MKKQLVEQEAREALVKDELKKFTTEVRDELDDVAAVQWK